MSESSLDCNPVEKIAAEFAERVRRGEYPSITEYVERYPDLADDIRELFPMLGMVEQFKPATGDGDPQGAASGASPCGDHPKQLGDYRILRYLGEGGMGIVYEAVRESLRNHVALKVMHRHFRGREDYLRRFVTEARSAARLHHTNIVSVFDYGVHDSIYYYAMQYVAGHSLDKILEDVRRLRAENQAVAPGTTATVSPGSQDSSALACEVFGEGGIAGDSLKQTVTLGFLTGVYPSPARPPETSGSNDQGATPALTRSVAEVDVAHAASPLSQLADFPLGGIGIGNTSYGPGPAGQSENHHAQRDDYDVADGSTSTLTGKTEYRYHREVARLGTQIAEGLAYAHKRGVFHRDIKPSNLIVDPLGNIWITDFGLAKFEEGEDLSQTHDVAGTLRYMAPERLRGFSDGRCDVYALGATLYELLTLRPAFDGSNQLELIHQIERDAPVRLRQIDGRISRDLETIVLKALAKNPGDRFASASEMAQELRRYLENRPIRSRPIPFYQQFWRWCQRNPWLAGANIAAATLTTLLAAVSTFAWWTDRDRLRQITRQRDAIQKAETEGRERLFDSHVSNAHAIRFSRRMGQRFESLEPLTQAADIGRGLKLPPKRLDPLRDEAIACMALPDLEPTGQVITMPTGVIAQTFDSTLTRYALRFRGGMVSVRRVADQQEIAHFHARGDREIWVFDLSPDGRYLATTHQPEHALTVWDIDGGRIALDEKPTVGAATFSPDSRRVALVKDTEVVVHDLATGQPSWRSPIHGRAAFRKDGAQVALLHTEKPWSCLILGSDTGKIVRSIPLPTRGEAVAWSPDGDTLATPCVDLKIYLWDTETGARQAVLTGHRALGLKAAFDHSGALLASSDWDGRLWLWDTVLGRHWLNLNGGRVSDFSADGRIALLLAGSLAMYQVNPACEYRSFVHAASPSLNYGHPSIQAGGRLLAVGTSGGVVLWDLARSTELTFLPIGLARHTTFEPSGDLLSSGALGVWRWPVRLNADRNELRVSPPIRLPLPASDCMIDEDRSGRILALADHSRANVLTPERSFQVGPLDDCRGVSVSPDGRWLETNRHLGGDIRVWRIQDGMEVAKIQTEGFAVFSPAGNWLMGPNGRRWEVGTWREGPKGGAPGHCFSPDGRMVVLTDADKIQRLVEAETGRTLARLESPDQCGVWGAAFSPDGTRLVLTTNDGPAVHVWDLRAIRRKLAEMGLDWDAPPLPDPERSAANSDGPSPLKVKVDYGQLQGSVEQYNSHLEQEAVPAEELLARCTERLKAHPADVDALHTRGHALRRLNRFEEALANFSAASAKEPGNAHLRAYQGVCLFDLKQYAPALDQLQAAFHVNPDSVRALFGLDQATNNLAWKMATGPERGRDAALAVRLAAFSVTLSPDETTQLNTLGVALYRAGKFAESIETLEKSLAAGNGQFDAFDLFFLAMAHHRLGHREEARDCYDRAARWLRDQKSLDPEHVKELAGFRGEAEALLARPAGELPLSVFAGEQ